MNFFKYIKLFSILLLPVFFANAQTQTIQINQTEGEFQTFEFSGTMNEVYVSDIRGLETDYETGDLIKGDFSLYNAQSTPQSDIYYSIYVGEYAPNGVDLINVFGLSEKFGPIYLGKNSVKSLPFSYTLPTSIKGKLGIEIIAELKDGTILGWETVPITVLGDVDFEIIPVKDANFDIDGKEFRLNSGPTATEEDTINLVYTIPQTNRVYTLKPSIKLFNRVHNSEILFSQDFDEIKTSKTENTVHSISLPVELEPFVYAGILSLEGGVAITEDIFFKYIVEGDIATIRNVNSDQIFVRQGETFTTTIEYAGQPINFNNPEKQNSSPAQSYLKIEVLGGVNKDEIIAEYEGEIDLRNTSVKIPLVANINSPYLVYNVEILKDGKVLSKYSTELVNNSIETVEYINNDGDGGPKKSTTSNVMIYSFLVLFLLGIIIYFLLSRGKNKSVLSMIVLMTSLSIGGGLVTLAESRFIASYSSSAGFSSIGMGSNNPSTIKNYQTGEEFFVQKHFNLIACGCTGTYESTLYGPPDDWVDWGPNLFDNSLEDENGNMLYLLDPEYFDDWYTTGNSISRTGYEIEGTPIGQEELEYGTYFNTFKNHLTLGPYFMPDEPGEYYMTTAGEISATEYTNGRNLITVESLRVLEDSCSNIDGYQTGVPSGMFLDSGGLCVPISTDACSNIPGDQPTVPEGYELGDGSTYRFGIDFNTIDDPSLHGTYIGEDTPLVINVVGGTVYSNSSTAYGTGVYDPDLVYGDVIFEKTTFGGGVPSTSFPLPSPSEGNDLLIMEGFKSIYNELSYNDFDGPYSSGIHMPQLGDQLTVTYPTPVRNSSISLSISAGGYNFWSNGNYTGPNSILIDKASWTTVDFFGDGEETGETPLFSSLVWTIDAPGSCVPIEVCSVDQGNPCTKSCSDGSEIEGVIQCNGNCGDYTDICPAPTTPEIPEGEEPPVNSCPILPTNVGSATYNIFDKAGNFVLTDPVPGDDKTTIDIFNQYFKSDILAEILVYNENNGDESDIRLDMLSGEPEIQSLSQTLPYQRAIQGSTNDTCSTSICPLSSGDAVYSNNEACNLEKEGENIITNGCYETDINNSLKLLTSPNFMNPGEYCTISWCAQGPDAQSCILVVDEETIGTGLSGTTSYQMGEQSEQVMLSCNNGAGGGEIQKIDNCRLHPDWNEF